MLRVGWGRQMFNEKFVYADFVCFDVGCFSLIMKCAVMAHPRKSALRPHCHHYYETTMPKVTVLNWGKLQTLDSICKSLIVCFLTHMKKMWLYVLISVGLAIWLSCVSRILRLWFSRTPSKCDECSTLCQTVNWKHILVRLCSSFVWLMIMSCTWSKYLSLSCVCSGVWLESFKIWLNCNHCFFSNTI